MSGGVGSDDDRLEQVVDMLTRIASGDLDARVSPTAAGDQLDVVITALNMFAEELCSSISEQKKLRETLEEQVEERTAELREKVRIVEAQSETILRLSTPVLQIWEGVLVLPLVGAIDTRRAEQLMDGLLRSIASTQASVVILDVTGVPLVDAAVADHLVTTFRACRLLGAEAILTGVSPQNAQTLVRLGVDLGGIHTTSSLKSGLRRALQIVENGP